MTALIPRAEQAARLLEAAYAHRLEGVIDRFDRDGVQACLALGRTPSGAPETWLVVPGTGYAATAGRTELATDWCRNLAAQIPAARSIVRSPRLGASGEFWWARGFLEAADLIDAWLGRRCVDAACGHSQGGAAVGILAWSRPDIAEAHAFGPARASFSPSAPTCPRLHCWTAPDDLVCSVPLGARHVGIVHELPVCRGGHAVAAYRQRLAMLGAPVSTPAPDLGWAFT